MHTKEPQLTAAEQQQHRAQGESVNAPRRSAAAQGHFLPLKVTSCHLQVLTVGGSSHHIDVFTNLSYRAFSLSF